MSLSIVALNPRTELIIVANVVIVELGRRWRMCEGIHRMNNLRNQIKLAMCGLKRLSFLRQNVFNNETSFGQRKMKLTHQGIPGAPYSENTR